MLTNLEFCSHSICTTDKQRIFESSSLEIKEASKATKVCCTALASSGRSQWLNSIYQQVTSIYIYPSIRICQTVRSVQENGITMFRSLTNNSTDHNKQFILISQPDTEEVSLCSLKEQRTRSCMGTASFASNQLDVAVNTKHALTVC